MDALEVFYNSENFKYLYTFQVKVVSFRNKTKNLREYFLTYQ